MEYNRFIIENYRAITEPLEINVGSNNLTPIIGVNECGKTTILSGIFAFDWNSDGLNGGRHLRDTQNLYGTASTTPIIRAEISLEVDDFVDALDAIEENADTETVDALRKYRRKRARFPSVLEISRDLKNDRYGFVSHEFTNTQLNNLVARDLVAGLPYIL